MSDAEQSEDGQVMSGVELSPSDDEETTDSLDIKPPQASSTYYGMSKRKDRKGKDRRHAKDHLRHHMMMEREGDRDRDRGGERRVDRGSNRMEREHYYREREHHAAGGREQHRHPGQGQGSSSRSGSGRDRSGSGRETSSRDKHHSSRYEMNPFYGEMRETYHSKRERNRDRGEREHRGERTDREREREREYNEKQQRRAEEKATDPEKIMEDLRTRLLHKKNRRDSKRGTEGGRDRDREAEQMHAEEEEYYAEKRERRREQHLHRRYREEEQANEGAARERTRHHDGDRRRHAEEVVEVLESPDHSHYHQQKTSSAPPRTAEEKEQEERRAKLLEADREMLRRKELAREELEARRLRKEEERGRGIETESEEDTDEEDDGEMEEEEEEEEEERPSYEDDDVEMVPEDDRARRAADQRGTKRRGERGRERKRHHRNRHASSHSHTSSSHGSEEDERDEEHPPGSPLSVGDLAKSDRRHSGSYNSQSRSPTNSRSGSESGSRSRSRSPRRHRRHEGRDSRSPSSRSRSREEEARKRPTGGGGGDDEGKGEEGKASGEAKPAVGEEESKEVEVKDTLPPYYPGIQGCRSVEEFLCLNRIEEGTYGVVYRAKDKRTEEIVALKRLKMEKEKEGFPITSLREINTLLKGQHPNIVTVREIVVGSNMDKIFIVMDYVEHDLKSLMETMKHKKQVFLPGEVKCLTQQLLRAVAHLHDNWILHRDLKTSNLLLSHKGILKVGDFGLAREYGSPLKPYTSIVVTLWYRAPELLLCCKEYSTPIDIWSVGCIFAEFLSMAALFPGKTEIDQLNRIFKDLGTPNEKIWPGYNELPAVQKMTFTEYPVSNLRKKFAHLTSELGISLLQGLLTFDPKQRLTAEAALQHNYFKELPLPIDPAMFPTWPAKSELGLKKALASSPKPPSGGGEFKKLGDDAVPDNAGFHLGGTTYAESRQLAMGPGFSLKF
ncbi:serine/threonine-protein kinase PITSLRE [Anopheles gambiae]|uniref:serine/threonine-protein kinase PITSLRE n=1 Tax=Anopheles gambiae TaxID=7165 RepID=UPI002AC9D9D3|nr:serine/threonine-protein kinase PITSLRE [Anopheles gambiae]